MLADTVRAVHSFAEDLRGAHHEWFRQTTRRMEAAESKLSDLNTSVVAAKMRHRPPAAGDGGLQLRSAAL